MADDFGSVLREHRRAAKLSQRELASQIGVDFSYISKVENGRLPPPAADTIVEICRVLDIEPEELLALTGKLPSDIQKTIGESKAAQEFLSRAQQMGLTDEDWRTMTKSLRSLKE